jgi:hypothetical protein
MVIPKPPRPGGIPLLLIVELILLIIQLIARALSDDEIVAEVCKRKGVSPETARQLIRKGRHR